MVRYGRHESIICKISSLEVRGGKPFTSFIWPTTLKKPTLFPLIDDEGVTVTRGFPLEPLPVAAPAP